MRPPVQTVVLLDLETTGLLEYENYETRMTELALVACERKHIFSTENGLPRVLYKLTMPVNPYYPIKDNGVSGLSNELLSNAQPFNKTFINILNLFLERLPKPICLLAQNGDKFDFAILQQQLFECRDKLLDDLICVDSRKIFISILKEHQWGLPRIYQELHGGKPLPNAHTAEGDCLGLLSCIIKKKEKFFTCLDGGEFVRLFNDVEPVKNRIINRNRTSLNRM